MTDVSDAVRKDGALPADGPWVTGRRARGAPRRPLAFLACVSALVGIVCSLLLPFAPVAVNEPTVSWPQDPARPTSTLLGLTAYRPLAIDVRFTCEAARLAQAAGGLVVSTAAPQSPTAEATGLVVVARGDRLRVAAFDRTMLDVPLGAADCEYRITGASRGFPSLVGPPLDPADPDAPDRDAFAGPANAELLVVRDGVDVAGTTAQQLPDVDVLATSLTAVPAGGLAVELRVDDEFTSSPTPLKSSLTWAAIVALAITAVLLGVLDSGTPRRSRRSRPGLPRLVDLAVPAVLLAWMFVAPATDDDGYYAAMARNSVLSGEVGNYYQLYDQSFTPFTWFYQALGWWQQLAGDTPVQQRVPAVVFGLLTWFALRRVVIAAMREWAPDRPAPHRVAHVVLAIAFLAWWVPQDMGVRPETVVALTGAATLLAVLTAARRRRLLTAWLAFLLAGLGFTAHPTGLTMLAPLVAGLPLLWPLVRVAGDRLVTALRVTAVVSGGMIALVMAFADGALRDFLRGQAIFLSIQAQEGWTTEIQRYNFLLSSIPMGNFAKRSAVLVCLVCLFWFAVLAVAARSRRVTLPTPLWYAASSTALAFATLWLTPSKWTHHFGALAGLGPVFVALLIVSGVPLVRRVLDGSRLPVAVPVAATSSFVVAIALAWAGPNQWPYAWLEGVRRPDLSPAIKDVPLDSVLLWGVAAAAVAGVAVAFGRLRRPGAARVDALLGVPVVVVVSLLGSTVYTVGTFGLAAVAGVPRESIWAQGLADPTGCGAAGVVRVLDPLTAAPLPVAAVPGLPAAAAPDGFVDGGGFAESDRPQKPVTVPVWGSLLPRDGPSPERNAGQMTTAWYALPPYLTDGAASTVLAAGTLSGGNSLTAVYARRIGETAIVVGAQGLTDEARDPAWRTFTLSPPPDADVVRLDAVDATGAVHGWLAFTAPAVQQPAVLAEYLPAGAPVALAWPLAFAYPCQRQPTVVDGITESPAFAVLWGDEALSGFSDGAWQLFRGGAFAPVLRTQSTQQLAVVHGVDPNIEVYRFASPYPRGAYTLSETRRVTPGASTAVGTAE